MPPEWTTHVSPEGGRFFVNSIMQVVTDTNIHDLQLYQRLQYGITEFQALSSQLDKGLPNHSELFIQLANPADEKCGQCNYYVVDHDTQTEYWLHPVDPYEMGIFRVTSESHISKYHFVLICHPLTPLNRVCFTSALLGTCGIFSPPSDPFHQARRTDQYTATRPIRFVL